MTSGNRFRLEICSLVSYNTPSWGTFFLSQKSTILLINGLYDKDYPPDSAVTYHWTEHEDQDLNRTLADTIITINHLDSYHIEIQMYPDQEIVMRVFEYGYHHPVTSAEIIPSDGKTLMTFLFIFSFLPVSVFCMDSCRRQQFFLFLMPVKIISCAIFSFNSR